MRRRHFTKSELGLLLVKYGDHSVASFLFGFGLLVLTYVFISLLFVAACKKKRNHSTCEELMNEAGRSRRK